MNTVRTRKKKYTYFIGIDISKNKLDFAVIDNAGMLMHRETGNDVLPIAELIQELKALKNFKLSNALFCMEDTGLYSNHLLTVLSDLKAFIALENPVKVRNSMGLLRGKDDKTDAIRLAHYAQNNKTILKCWEPRRKLITDLMLLSSLRVRLNTAANTLKVPLKEQVVFVRENILSQSKSLCRKSIDALQTNQADVEDYIEHLVNDDPRLKRLKQIITSIPSVGSVTAIQMIILTNEFKNFNDPKKFACYAGVAPFKRQSGTITHKARVSPVANRKIKSLLHVCALSAIRYDPEMKTYYERKTQIEAKPKMAVLNAIRYKLILRIFVCVSQDRCFERNYCRQGAAVTGAYCIL